jgi:hypothetical protein
MSRPLELNRPIIFEWNKKGCNLNYNSPFSKSLPLERKRGIKDTVNETSSLDGGGHTNIYSP